MSTHNMFLWRNKKTINTPLIWSYVHTTGITVFDLIATHTPIGGQSNNSVVSSLQPVYFLSTSL